ncbi:MAG: hypothetical protein LBH43_10520 [Treponema sp.]|jgi:hypothetical protein|nr:hypothetical protein [Treponema sp.]
MKKSFLLISALTLALCFMGCDDDGGEEDKPLFEVTVSGLPTGKIFGASLLNNDNDPVATAGLPAAGGKFYFFEPNKNNTPNTAKPFGIAGDYFLSLAEVDLSTLSPTAIYALMDGENLGKVTIDQDITPVTVQWDDFKAQL